MRISNSTNTYNNFFYSKQSSDFNITENKEKENHSKEIDTPKKPREQSNDKSESTSKIVTNSDGSRVLFIKTTTAQGATFCQNIKLSDTDTFSQEKDISNNVIKDTNLEVDNDVSQIN